MFFATPIWLLALVPWAALAAWLLWGRPERVNVPFLALWRDADAPRPSSSRTIRLPPLAIILLLIAILLGILAAGSPTVFRSTGAKVAILVDRGVTMSARDGDAHRYAEPLRVVLALLGDGSSASIASIPESVSPEAILPTGVGTSRDVEQAARRLLGTSDGPVVVITDQPLNVADARLVVVRPAPLDANAGIAHVAAREKPEPQVMVTVVAHPPSKQAVVVASDGERLERTIDAPGTAFIDVPRLGRTVEVTLAQGDALAADDRAWLVRETGWPRIEPMGPLPAELSRMVDTYARLRPPRADARVVSIGSDADDAAGDAVLIGAADAAAEDGIPVVADHPVTAGVAWPAVLGVGTRIATTAPRSFTPAVTSGGRVAVAVRDTPVRQVWVAIDSATFPRRADYVVFWTNVFDWLGHRGGDAFAAHPVGLLGSDWWRLTDGPVGAEPGLWPGVYERGDGTVRAVNASRVTLPPSPAVASDWREELSGLLARGGGGRPLAPYVLLGALACALGAALSWPARRGAQT